MFFKKQPHRLLFFMLGGENIQQEKMTLVPLSEKYGLTIDEAAEYFGIGQKKLRELSSDERCPFVLWIGSKRLIKRHEFEQYLNKRYTI